MRPSSIPPISVLLPVHNSQRYVRAAVESVLNQTFSEFELLAIDDGSTDRSLSILRELAAKDRRLNVVSRENQGLVATLNELITLARGHYLARMDSDDICRPQRFQKQVAYLDSHPECVAVGTRCLVIDPEGLPIIEYQNETTHDEIDAMHMWEDCGSRMCHPSVMMRRKEVVQVGAYDERYRFAEDLDLFLRLAEIGKLANLPEVLLEYRQHLGSVCYTYNNEQRDISRKAVAAAKERRRITGGNVKLGWISNPESHADIHRHWAWLALSARNLVTARKHAIHAVVADPFSLENLKILACAIRGH